MIGSEVIVKYFWLQMVGFHLVVVLARGWSGMIGVTMSSFRTSLVTQGILSQILVIPRIRKILGLHLFIFK